MTTSISDRNSEGSRSRRRFVFPSSGDALRILAVGAGVCAAILFIVVGLRFELQLYGDGAFFSYAVAVRDSWAFHWHNISGRLFVYLFCVLPAETYVGLTRDARGGIDIYGLLFFFAQLLGLVATFIADRSKGRVIFSYACFSSACLCPLVFGVPTEMWMAHALSWPALAICHDARRGVGRVCAIFVVLLALVFTHAGALAFVAAILLTLLLRGRRDAAFLRAAAVFVVVMVIWIAVVVSLRPDAYFASALPSIALSIFNPALLTGGLVLLLAGALAGYGAAFLTLWRWAPERAHLYVAAAVAGALAIYWLWFDHALHADNRYYLRTMLIAGTPVLGMLAAVHALEAERRIAVSAPWLRQLRAALGSDAMARAVTGALLLILLVHVVETAKFVAAWTDYKAAIRTLATGTASDPALGDPRFVSSARLGAKLNRLSWFSTTQFLSVLVAPDFAPARLVSDPDPGYIWFSCATATANAAAVRAVPAVSRDLIRTHTCLHRKD
jgi:hypothetical protein